MFPIWHVVHENYKFCRRSEYSSILGNSCIVSIVIKNYYDQHEILHKCKKKPFSDSMVLHTGNNNIKLFDNDLTFDATCCNTIALLVGNTIARAGNLVGKAGFNQLVCGKISQTE